MTLLFQIILILSSITVAAAVLRKVARSRAKIEDSIFWLGLCSLLVVFSLFPGIPDFLASLFGVYSTINFIFAFFIFVLIVKLFSSSIRISKLEMQMQELSQSIAIHEQDDLETQKDR